MPLLDEISLRLNNKLIKLQVEYQWRPRRCPSCCSFGHTCPSPVVPAPVAASVAAVIAETAPVLVPAALSSPAPTAVVAASVPSAVPAVLSLPATSAAHAAAAVASLAAAAPRAATVSSSAAQAAAVPSAAHAAAVPSSPALAAAAPSSPARAAAVPSSPTPDLAAPLAAVSVPVSASPVIVTALAAVKKLPAPPASPRPSKADANPSQQRDDPFFRVHNSFFELDDDGLDEALDEAESYFDGTSSSFSIKALSPKTRGQKARHDPILAPSTAPRQNVWVSGKKKNRGKGSPPT